MKQIIKDAIFGLITSFVPIILITLSINQSNNSFIKKHQLNPEGIIKYAPLLFIITNVLVMALLRTLKIRNWFIIGGIFALIYSSIGRFILKIPQNIFKISPNNFQLYAIIIWSIFYGIIGQYFYKLI